MPASSIDLHIRLPAALFADPPANCPIRAGERTARILLVTHEPRYILRLPAGPIRQLVDEVARVLAELGLHREGAMLLSQVPASGRDRWSRDLTIGLAPEITDRLAAPELTVHLRLRLQAHRSVESWRAHPTI